MTRHIKSPTKHSLTQQLGTLRMALPLMVLMGVSACGSDPFETEVEEQAAVDPEGAALPLSIGGRAQTGDDDDLSTAINCAAAAGFTAERLASMSSDPRSREIAVFRKAEEYFTGLAEEAAKADETAVGSVEVAIARKRNETQDETTEQVQLAIACLRRYGSEIEGQL